jgi:hypothetical protein
MSIVAMGFFAVKSIEYKWYYKYDLYIGRNYIET